MTSTHMSCRSCGHSGEFWLTPDGEIICADEDCHAVFGRWLVTPEQRLDGDRRRPVVTGAPDGEP